MVHVGVIGGGIRGQLYAQALAGVPGVSIAGFAEPAPAVRDQLTGLFAAPVFADHEALLDSAQTDAIIVATPDFAHRDAAIAAARAGKALLIEKPLAMSLDDAADIRAAVEEAGVGCLLGFENRWNPHFIRLHEAIEEGELGPIVQQRATLANTTYVPMTMLSWASLSSPAWFLLPHTVDLALWLSGRTPRRVTATARAGLLRSQGIDTWDAVALTIEFDDESSASLSASWILPPGTPGIVAFDYHVLGEAGSANATLDDQGLTITAGKPKRPWPLAGIIGGEPVGPPVWMARDWIRMVRGEEPWGPGVRHGEHVTRIIAAAELAIDERRWVDLD